MDPLSVTPRRSTWFKWRRKPRVRLRRVFISKRFSFSVLLKKQKFDYTLTGYNFLNITPNELILFPTSLKFCLVYFQIYFKNLKAIFLYCFETMF